MASGMMLSLPVALFVEEGGGGGVVDMAQLVNWWYPIQFLHDGHYICEANSNGGDERFTGI